MDLYGFENGRSTLPGERFGLQQIRPPSAAGTSGSDITKEDVAKAQELSQTREGQVLVTLAVQQDREKGRTDERPENEDQKKISQWVDFNLPQGVKGLSGLAKILVDRNPDLAGYLSGPTEKDSLYIPGLKEIEGPFRDLLKEILKGTSVWNEVKTAYQLAGKAEKNGKQDGSISRSELKAIKPEEAKQVLYLAVIAQKVFPFYNEEKNKPGKKPPDNNPGKPGADQKPKEPRNLEELILSKVRTWDWKAMALPIGFTALFSKPVMKVLRAQSWCPSALLPAAAGATGWLQRLKYRGAWLTGYIGVGAAVYFSTLLVDKIFEEAGVTDKVLGPHITPFVSFPIGMVGAKLAIRHGGKARELLPLLARTPPIVWGVVGGAAAVYGILHWTGVDDELAESRVIGWISDWVPQKKAGPQKFGQYALDGHSQPLKGDDGAPLTYEEKSFRDYLKNLLAIRGSQGDEACLKVLEAARDRDELRLYAANGREGGLKDGIKPLKPEFRRRLDTEIQELIEVTKTPEAKLVAANSGPGEKTKGTGQPSRGNGARRGNGVAQAEKSKKVSGAGPERRVAARAEDDMSSLIGE